MASESGRESTPEKPESGEKPGDKPGSQPKQQGEDGDPRGDQASKNPAENRESRDPSQGGKDRTAVGADPAERWGDLPVHARDIFRSQGGGSMPARYRDWIDAYYKRLSKNP